VTDIKYRPVIVYAESEKCDRGSIVLYDDEKAGGKFIICHPLDLPRLEEILTGFTLVNLRDRILKPKKEDENSDNCAK
jgi:hypothetical protein